MLHAAWLSAYAAIGLLVAWSRSTTLTLLYVSAGVLLLACGIALFARPRVATLWLRSALLLTVLVWLIAAFFASRVARIGSAWDQLSSQRNAQVHAALDRRMNVLLEQGQRTVDLATQLAFPLATDSAGRRQLFTQVDQLRARSNVDALAIFSENGQLLAWSGAHQGVLPEQVRPAEDAASSTRLLFVERPLYSYLYFLEPMRGGRGQAMAAVLIDAALPEGAPKRGVAHEVDELAGRSAVFLAGGAPNSWNFVLGADTLLHASIDPLTQSDWRDNTLQLAQRVILILAAVVVLLLTLGWFRHPWRPGRFHTLLPLLGTICAILVAPIGPAFGAERFFEPGLFVFPAPGDISLGTLLVVLLVTGSLVATLHGTRFPRLGAPGFIFSAVALAIVYPVALNLLIGPGSDLDQYRAATPALLQNAAIVWGGLQISLVLLLGIATALLLIPAQVPPAWQRMLRRTRLSFGLLASAVVTAALLSLLILWLSRTRQAVPHWVAAFWCVPFVLGALGIPAHEFGGRRLLRWVFAGFLAATAVLPYLWVAQVNARLRDAERELQTLGTRPDPLLEYLLRQFARETIARRERGEDNLQLLYRSWVASGLARESYPVRITLWAPDGRSEVQLPLGDAFSAEEERLTVIPLYMEPTVARVQAQGEPVSIAVSGELNVNQLLAVPLEAGRVVTVEVPPRRSLERASVIAPLLGESDQRSGTRLDLVPARNSAPGGLWRPVENGWRSEARVQYPEGGFHAHLSVRLPNAFVRIARGVLLITTTVLIFAGLWLLGRAMRAEDVRPGEGWTRWIGSFRARVTGALFLFFLTPTVLFGWVAYGALFNEVARAARIVAERAARQAVIEFPDSDGDLRELSSHAGTDIQMYLQGELVSVSAPAALQLGVYNAWMPPLAYMQLESGEEDATTATEQIGVQEYLTAFRKLQVAGTGTMGIPVSLESSDMIIRQNELAHLVLFAALIGGVLSFGLSILVGRTLTVPIGRLQRAAAAVGAGKLRVKLPENGHDEFGELYRSFNRMARRLRRARAQEIRTARVLAWGDMARQIAHEIKNPLTPIKLAIQHLRRAYNDNRPDFGNVLDRNVDQILVEIDRLTDIARAFSRYGAPPESAGPLEHVRISRVVQESLTLYRSGDTRIEYVDEVRTGLPPVIARTGELKEVLLNLIENARLATPEGGTILVSAHLDGANMVELRVSDTGEGIPEDQLEEVFEPHFSTRSTGTGLGLLIVRRLIESWGGTVSAESRAGHGTTIRVRLQIAKDEVVAAR